MQRTHTQRNAPCSTRRTHLHEELRGGVGEAVARAQVGERDHQRHTPVRGVRRLVAQMEHEALLPVEDVRHDAVQLFLARERADELRLGAGVLPIEVPLQKAHQNSTTLTARNHHQIHRGILHR